MILLFILFLPVICGFFLLFLRNPATIRLIASVSAFVNLLISLFLILPGTPASFSAEWNSFMGMRFSLGYDGISLIMILLTNFLFPFILLSGLGREQKQPGLLNFLILLTQSALLGVFLAKNAFLFYIFWELSLIPVYFILLLRGGEQSRFITLKFFIYTLAGSLFLLFGIIYLFQLTPGIHSTDFSAFSQLNIPANTQIWLFWVLFIAFAIKMPLFPFHTWQPSTYTMASPQGVMILAGLMTKMGIYGTLRFIFPIVPQGVLYWQNTVIVLSLTGMIYASIIAFRQSDLKKLIAFSSMAHVSLMVTAMFVLNTYALQGLLLQTISHGVTIVALFYLVNLIFEKTGTLELQQMGGIKLDAPNLSVVFLLVVLGTIALPLTSGFVGEFLMLTGLFKQSVWVAAVGGTTLILGAVYMLYAYQRVMLGDKNPGQTNKISDLGLPDYVILTPLIFVFFALGIYPQPVFNLLEGSFNSILSLIGPVRDAVITLIN